MSDFVEWKKRSDMCTHYMHKEGRYNTFADATQRANKAMFLSTIVGPERFAAATRIAGMMMVLDVLSMSGMQENK